MKQQATRTVLLGMAMIVGCGRVSRPAGQAPPDLALRPLDNATINAGLDPADERIVALVKYFERNGITLESEGSGWWRVTRPGMTGRYDMRWSIRSFPDSASEPQMAEALGRINLAYMLNPRSHLAMCNGCIRAPAQDRHPESDDELPKWNGVPLRKAIQELFMQYRAG